jgi:uncharacterized protein (TIGR03437 family)
VKNLSAIVLALGLAASAFAQPKITQIQNAASNAVNALPGTATGECQCSTLPNGAIAQGSLFSIYGTGFGPSTATLWNPYPLPTTLGGTTVAVSVPTGATPIAAYMEFAGNFGSYSQVNAVLPSTVQPGAGTITVTSGGQTSATFPITVVAFSFGNFTINQAGTGPGIITDTAYQVLSPFHTAKPGDYVIAWGTGMGPAPNLSTEGSAPPPATPVNLCPGANCPTVWVGGTKSTNVYYAGRSQYTAVDQVIFQVPPSAQGCYVQVAVQTGSIVGNFASMTVDPNGATCQDADGINYNDLDAAVKANGKANVGAISMLSNFLNLSVFGTPLQWDNDTVSGEIGAFTGSTTGLGDLATFQGFTLAPSVNNCSVSPFFAYPPPKDPVLSEVTYLDAGPSLSIKGANGTTAPIAQNCTPASTSGCGAAGKGYSGLVGGASIAELLNGGGTDPLFLSDNGWPGNGSSYTYAIEPGLFTVTGAGGGAVGAISAPITVSPAAASFVWTNEKTITSAPIPRNTPLTITWTGGDGFVDITAISSTLLSGTTPQPTTPGILVECIAPASDQTFTIPTYVLASLPSTTGSTALVPPGELLVGPASVACSNTSSTSATCATIPSLPSGLDALYIFYHYIGGDAVTWQ